MTAHLAAICTGHRAPLANGRGSAIDKRPREGAVEITADGAVGDEIVNTVHHGGVDQALYAYADEDAGFWAEAYGRATPAGCFGENLRVAGLDVTGSRIGDHWRIGDVVEVVVTAPRIPCANFASFWGQRDLVARFLEVGRPGAYLRVVTPGTVAAGDPVEVVRRGAHDVTVADVMRIVTGEREQAADLLALPDLSHRLRDRAAALA